MPEAIDSSQARSQIAPMGWHALPLTSLTKIAIMASFSHYENFSYDEKKGGFLVEVPVPPGRGKVSRATPAVLKDHVEVGIKLTRGGKLATNQTRRPLGQCYSWWLGQLIHYGLPLVLSTDEAKEAVKSEMLAGDLKVPDHLKKMEQRMQTAFRRREKTKAMTLDIRSTSKTRRNKVKVKPGASDSEDDSDICQTPSSRRHSQGQVKIEANASSESDSARSINSSDAKTDSYESEEVSSPAHTKIGSSSIAKYPLSTVKTQSSRFSKVKPWLRKVSSESSSKNSSSENDDDGDPQDLLHDAVSTEEEQNSPEADSDYKIGDDMSPADTKTLPVSHDSEDENADGVSFSSNSGYERAVVSHSQAINGACARHGVTDTDSSSGSSYNNDAEIQSKRQPRLKNARNSSKAPHNASKSDRNNGLNVTINKATPKFITLQSARPKQQEIKRDRRQRCMPKKRTEQDHQNADAVETPIPPAEAANVHPEMTYEDIRDQITRYKIVRMRSRFPRETIHLCYICLAKHKGDYDESCQELANASLALTPAKPAQTTLQDAQAPSSLKRKRSSIPEQAAAGKLQVDFALSESDKPIFKQEPTPKGKKASRLKKRASLVSDAMHGSRIDLTVLDDTEIAEDTENNTPAKKRVRKRGSRQRATAHDAPSPEPFQAASAEIPWVSAAKLRTAKREKPPIAFPYSSPPARTALKGILKSSPSFQSRHGLLSQAPDSAGPPLRHHRKTSSDLLRHPPRRNSEPDLQLQPSLRKAQQKVASQHQVSSNPYTTESRWQVLNSNHKSKMRPSGQIEEEAQPEPRNTLFPQETNRIVGLSLKDGGGLLQRGIVRNPSTSNSTSTKRKHREKGF